MIGVVVDPVSQRGEQAFRERQEHLTGFEIDLSTERRVKSRRLGADDDLERAFEFQRLRVVDDNGVVFVFDHVSRHFLASLFLGLEGVEVLDAFGLSLCDEEDEEGDALSLGFVTTELLTGSEAPPELDSLGVGAKASVEIVYATENGLSDAYVPCGPQD